IVMPPDEQGLSLPSPDRLSNLNIHLIDDILCRLSFRDVVRVSTLSKDWQYICWRVPHVKFDQTMWKTPEDLTSPTIGFIPIIDSFLRLIFKSVTLSFDKFEILISNCPLLEDLVLKDIDNLYFMSINAPKLRSFVFCGDIQLIHLENVPVLSNDLYAPTKLVLEDEDDFVNIFSSIPGLECFSWDLFEEYILSHGDYFECVPQEFVDEIRASFSDITFNNLRIVKFYDVLFEEVEMQLINYFLANSPALVKMVIKLRQMETNKSLNVLAEITKFQRASSKAEVVYLVD
ncbi:hypothetical protein EJD97_010819, partial [Solanum chilense]